MTLREQALRKRIESKAEIYASMRVLRGVHPTEWQCAKQNYQEIAISLAPLLLEMAAALENVGVEARRAYDKDNAEFMAAPKGNPGNCWDAPSRHLQTFTYFADLSREALSSLDRFLSGGEGK